MRPGSWMAGCVDTAAASCGATPLVGDTLAAPFRDLARHQQVPAGTAQDYAGQRRQRLAMLAGVLVAAVPIVVLLVLWLPRRLRLAREASAASRLVRRSQAWPTCWRSGLWPRQPLRRLARLDPDVVGGLEGRRPRRRPRSWPGSSSTSSACAARPRPGDRSGHGRLPAAASRPAGVPRGSRGEEPADGGRVVQPPGEHRLDAPRRAGPRPAACRAPRPHRSCRSPGGTSCRPRAR